MSTHKDIIARWPSIADFAADIGVSVSHASQMKWRSSIPGRYWKPAADGAQRRGLPDVTLELIATIGAESEASSAA